MEINEKFEFYLITTGCDDLISNEYYLIGKMDDNGFYFINFYPLGEPEAFICCVAKGSK